MEIDVATRKRIETLLPRLNEADRRMYLAAGAESLGRGGIGAVAGVAGVSRSTVTAGARDLAGDGGVGAKPGVMSLIAPTTTEEGLRVLCGVDTRTYEAGVRVTDDEMGSLDLELYGRHGDWNYVIRPRTQLALDDSEVPSEEAPEG